MSLKVLTKNISYLMIARITTTIFVSGSMLFLVRYLGPEKLGIYSFVITLLFIFSALSDPGISMFLTKEIAQNPEKTQHFFREHLTAQIMITAVTIFFVIIAAIFTESPLIKTLLLLGIMSLVFNGILYPFATVLSAKEDMKFNVICSFLGGISTIAITFIGIHRHYGLSFFMLLGIIPSFISLIVAMILSHKYIKIQLVAQCINIKKIILNSLPFFALTSTGLLYTRIDLIMLKLIDSNHIAGLYNAAYKIIFFLFVIPISVRSAVYPMLSNYHKNKNERVVFLKRKFIK